MGKILSEEEMQRIKEVDVIEKKAAFATLEKVYSKILNSNDDLSQIKLDLIGDIVVAKVMLDMADKGAIDEAKLKEFIANHF